MGCERSADTKFTIGIPLYTNFDSLDVLGPFQTFYMQHPVLQTWLLGPTKDPVASFEGVKITPDCDFNSCPQLDIVFVPGGTPLETLLSDERRRAEYLNFIRRQAAGAKLVTSVCTGSILLALAGVLDGYKATTHWGFKTVLELFPKVTVADGFPRFVIDANRITGGGISSGLDEAMAIVALLLGNDAAKQGQLTMQYAPRPPFNDGDPSTAEPSVLYKVSSDFRSGVDSLSQEVEKLLGCGKAAGA